MFDFPVTPPARAALLGLLILWAALLLAGLLFGKPGPDRRNRLPLPLRMALSLTLLAAAGVWQRADTAGTPPATFGMWLTIGMACGMLGDLFMAGILIPKPRHVIFGILAFGAGHVAYLLAFLQIAQTAGLHSGPVWTWSLGLCLLLGVGLWLLLVRAPARGVGLNIGTLLYTWLLALMAGSAFALALQTTGFGPLAVGAALFMLSDLILGNELMRRTHFPFIGDVIWTSYTVAQMLIIYGATANALRFL